MNDPARNKFAFALRVHERRIAELERRLGIVSPKSPLESTDRPTTAEPQTACHVRPVVQR